MGSGSCDVTVRADAGPHRTGTVAPDLADEPIGPTVCARLPNGRLAERADSLARDVCWAEITAQQHVGDGAELHRRVPPVDVVARIGLGDPEPLRACHALGDAEPLLHRLEHDRGGGREHPAHRAQTREWEALAREREHRCAVHHRRLESILAAAVRREAKQLPVTMHQRPLVRGDGVRAMLEDGAEVVERRLTGVRIERDRLEHHVGTRLGEPVVDVAARHPRRLRGVEPLGVGTPTDATRCHAGDGADDAMIARERVTPTLEQGVQRSTHAAISDEGDAHYTRSRSW